MYADDFTGVAGTLQELQALVDVTRGWCARWHLQANIGESKSAAMLFAPEASPGPLRAGSPLLPRSFSARADGVWPRANNNRKTNTESNNKKENNNHKNSIQRLLST
jgi:hypothetical protein